MRADTVYFIPGTQCNEQLWQWLWPELTELNCVHLSIPMASSLTHAVAQLLDQLPDHPVKLFGFSLGGYLAASLAVAQPARIERLMICANSGCALPSAEVRQRQQLLHAIKRFGYRGLHDSKIAQMVAPENLGRVAIAECMRAMDKCLGVENLINQLTVTSGRSDLLDPLAMLSIPIVYCYGDRDQLVDRAWVAALEQRNPKVSQTLISGCGHMLPLEQPQALAQKILAWCR